MAGNLTVDGINSPGVLSLDDVSISDRLDLTGAEVVGLPDAGKVLQVKSFQYKDAESFVGNAYTFYDTGLELSITPTSVNSDVLVMYVLTGHFYLYPLSRITRNGVLVGQGLDSTYPANSLGNSRAEKYEANSMMGTILDSPGTVSPVKYTISIGHLNSLTSPIYINKLAPGALYERSGISTITLMEIAG